MELCARFENSRKSGNTVEPNGIIRSVHARAGNPCAGLASRRDKDSKKDQKRSSPGAGGVIPTGRAAHIFHAPLRHARSSPRGGDGEAFPPRIAAVRLESAGQRHVLFAAVRGRKSPFLAEGRVGEDEAVVSGEIGRASCRKECRSR